jgi:hypothetical protein
MKRSGRNRDGDEHPAGAAPAEFVTVILSRESFPLPAIISLDLEGPRNVPCRRETPQDELIGE